MYKSYLKLVVILVILISNNAIFNVIKTTLSVRLFLEPGMKWIHLRGTISTSLFFSLLSPLWPPAQSPIVNLGVILQICWKQMYSICRTDTNRRICYCLRVMNSCTALTQEQSDRCNCLMEFVIFAKWEKLI